MEEPLETRMLTAAHHEAGHIVVAAVCGLKIRTKGIVIDAAGEGLACYCKEPDDSGPSIKRLGARQNRPTFAP